MTSPASKPAPKKPVAKPVFSSLKPIPPAPPVKTSKEVSKAAKTSPLLKAALAPTPEKTIRQKQASSVTGPTGKRLVSKKAEVPSAQATPTPKSASATPQSSQRTKAKRLSAPPVAAVPEVPAPKLAPKKKASAIKKTSVVPPVVETVPVVLPPAKSIPKRPMRAKKGGSKPGAPSPVKAKPRSRKRKSVPAPEGPAGFIRRHLARLPEVLPTSTPLRRFARKRPPSVEPETALGSAAQAPLSLDEQKPEPQRREPTVTPARSPVRRTLPTVIYVKDGPPIPIPPILLEGDEPSPVSLSGPGQKYLVSPVAPAVVEAREVDLPPVFATGEIMLTARDPRCLYAHWDISAYQQRQYNSLSAHQHLVMRTHRDGPSGPLISEIHVHPESKHWFLHVPDAATSYACILGYYDVHREWRAIAVSQSVTTPGDRGAAETVVQFATILPDVPLPQVELRMPAPSPPASVERAPDQPSSAPEERSMVPFTTWPRRAGQSEVSTARSALRQGPPPGTPEHVQAKISPAPAPGIRQFPAHPAAPPAEIPVVEVPVSEWTSEQEQVLVEVVATTPARQEWIGSIAIAELARQEVKVSPRGGVPTPAFEAGSMAAAQFGQAPEEAVFSPGAGPGEALGPEPHVVSKSFWFRVNAELVIYGSTEPDATVRIAGRPIRLRSDGSFSFRFSLPDGDYDLPITARAAHGEERSAELRFYRSSQYAGQVGAHPQDPALKPPLPENAA